jgi:nicotinamide mononucleotide transporter
MTDPVEWAGFVLSLAMVYCNIKEIHWGWPLAIASSLLYGLVFWNSQLYGQAGLQIMFMLMAAWGWQQWLRGRPASTPDALLEGSLTATSGPLPISSLQPNERKYLVMALLLAWLVCALILKQYTDSQLVISDSFVTALGLMGQYLLGRKKIENWWVWLAVNLLTMMLMASQSLWITSLLYGIFAVLSVVGLSTWRKQYAQ